MTINIYDYISIIIEKKNDKGKDFFVISGFMYMDLKIKCDWTYVSDFIEYIQCFCSNQLNVNGEYTFDKFTFKVEKIDTAYGLIICDDCYNYTLLPKFEAKKIIAKANRIIARTNILHKVDIN